MIYEHIFDCYCPVVLRFDERQGERFHDLILTLPRGALEDVVLRALERQADAAEVLLMVGGGVPCGPV